ncbi:hypothetical protein [Streptomyces sasae]|uniref:hypothetical protein n=1 Tax=Streptomyces sasae TaxID=1266772 RepID=UPI00292F3A42|nr:hypothetical protein [Streptomyces sasae]
MSTQTVVTLASVAAAAIAIVFCALRKALKEAEALLLALVPVIHALGKVRAAWRQTRHPQEEDVVEEEARRALP